MRILVESGAYDVLNLGDVAMLKVCVQRLRALWPDAHVDVVTVAPARLAVAVPGATPLPPLPLRWWTEKPVFHVASLPRFPGGMTRAADNWLRRWAPVTAWRATRLRDRLSRVRAQHAKGLACFEEAFANAQAVVACGGGYLADAFSDHAVHVLSLLARAQTCGKPTAMFGQGLGPASHPVLCHCLRAGLRRLKLLTLREGLRGEGLLRELGVRAPEFVVTGDDAVELAHPEEPAVAPEAIGFNMRMAWFVNIDESQARLVRDGVTQAAKGLGTRILPLPISLFETVNDSRVAMDLLGGAGLLVEGWSPQLTVEQVIADAGRCGVVVTSSYHAAVFALAQGVPAIGLMRSAYSADKFRGLAGLFGPGAESLHLDELKAPGELAAAILRLWEQRSALRPGLVAAAIQQRDASRRAYARFKELA